MPKPLRTDEHRMGVPGLKGYDKQRVDRDNEACEFVLAECALMNSRGGRLT